MRGMRSKKGSNSQLKQISTNLWLHNRQQMFVSKVFQLNIKQPDGLMVKSSRIWLDAVVHWLRFWLAGSMFIFSVGPPRATLNKLLTYCKLSLLPLAELEMSSRLRQ